MILKDTENKIIRFRIVQVEVLHSTVSNTYSFLESTEVARII